MQSVSALTHDSLHGLHDDRLGIVSQHQHFDAHSPANWRCVWIAPLGYYSRPQGASDEDITPRGGGSSPRFLISDTAGRPLLEKVLDHYHAAPPALLPRIRIMYPHSQCKLAVASVDEKR